MNSILPNRRLLCLPSESRGEDWAGQVLKIDDYLSGLGMDLAEESVFLLFDRGPGAVLNNEGHTIVGRSVVGPKKMVENPLQLIDWVAQPVHRKKMESSNWQDVFEEAYQEWEKLQQLNQKTSPSFILCLKRRVSDALVLEIEVIFSE